MKKRDKETLRKSIDYKIKFLHIKQGLIEPLGIKHLLLLIPVVVGFACTYGTNVFFSANELPPSYFNYIQAMIFLISICLEVVSLFFIGFHWQTLKHRKGFLTIGLMNSVQRAPELLSKIKEKDAFIFEYYSNGLSLKQFIDAKDKIETILNLAIIDIYNGKSKSRVLIKAVRGESVLPTYIEWDDKKMLKSDYRVVLGQDLQGLKVLDFSMLPHVQCGGQTGSGKTVLLACVLHQLYKNGAEIFLVDFKGLIDFPKDIETRYHCITSKEALNKLLDSMISVMEERKSLFKQYDCANIKEFNKRLPGEECKQIYIASDEIAFAFQKKGLKKEEKELTEQIEAKMSLLAQQSRFAGIHMWLSTQRGDADTIPPQIRSNLTFRICGRANEILSRVTIDSTKASEIPNSIQGRFVDDAENMFQAFYYNEV